jgi:PAS domain S-box-containing protein
MTEKKNKPTESATSQAAALRQKAEEAFGKQQVDPVPVAPEDTQRLLHELRVHQIELEMQNDDLRRAQAELDAARARYFDLYDLAPVGYCTVSEQGLILEANLTAATMLGVVRGALARQPVSRFIHKENSDSFYLHCKQLLETGEPKAFELRMVKKDGTAFWAHLEATAAQNETGAPVCRVVMSDITGMKKAQEVLQKALNEVRTLRGIVPICSNCKNIRDDQGYWRQVEVYVRDHTEAEFSHGICQECIKKLYPLLKKDDGSAPENTGGLQ